MATPFTNVYDVMLSQLTDPIFLANDDDDSLKKRYLLNSIPRFARCKKDLSQRNDIQFTADLSDEEMLILGTLMAVEYLKPQISSLENIKQSMGSRDFSLTSQAAHLDQLRKLRNDYKKDADDLIVQYTYNNSNLSGLK
nr:hypothetical protein [Mycobacterium sp. E3298]